MIQVFSGGGGWATDSSLRVYTLATFLQGWQDVAFISPANLVFVYLLIRAQLGRESCQLETLEDLQSLVRTCLYLSYSYIGHEM